MILVAGFGEIERTIAEDLVRGRVLTDCGNYFTLNEGWSVFDLEVLVTL